MLYYLWLPSKRIIWRHCRRSCPPLSASAMPAAPSPFAIRDFRFYWTARLASTVAQMAMVIVIGWQVYDIARQTMDTKAAALQLGLVGLVQFVPLFALTLITGWTADRVDRRFKIGRAHV